MMHGAYGLDTLYRWAMQDGMSCGRHYAVSFDSFYEEYKERYQIIKRQREIAKREEPPSIEKYRLKPNAMQVGFITNLRKILEKGEDRALLISATGERGIFVTGGRNPGFTRVSEAWS